MDQCLLWVSFLCLVQSLIKGKKVVGGEGLPCRLLGIIYNHCGQG